MYDLLTSVQLTDAQHGLQEVTTGVAFTDGADC